MRRERYGRPVARVVTIALAAVLLVGCSGNTPKKGEFEVSPRAALLDVPVSVTLRGVDPGAKVAVSLSATDRAGVRWTSSASFVASSAGTLSLADPSVGGSYRGRNPMGLFELMTPHEGSARAFLSPDGGYDAALVARLGTRTVASSTLRRQDPRSVGITTRTYTVARNGVHGTLYLPKDTSPRRPAVLIFGGSEGGESTDFNASLLAAHGFPSLSVAYFDAPGLPGVLKDVPLEYFTRALRLLARAPGADPSRLFVSGGSRGSEAALLLGVHFPRLVYGAAVGSPSDHVNGAYAADNSVSGAAWTLRGKPVPYAPARDFLTPHPAEAKASIIDVAAIRGPVLTICGQDDLLWSSCEFAASIASQRQTAGKAAHDVYLSYPRAGHLVDLAAGYVSLAKEGTAPGGESLGGSLPVDLPAAADAHQRLLQLLRTATR